MLLNNLHSNLTPNYGTPKKILQLSKFILGEIELDPASNQIFNNIVQAKQFFTDKEDGLIQDWREYKTIFLNPPSGRYKKTLPPGLESIKTKSLPKLFWQKLLNNLDYFDHCIYIAYSIEQLQTTQRECSQALLDFPFCIGAERFSYINLQGQQENNGTHSSAVVYIPGKINKFKVFKRIFSRVGKCCNC